MNLAGMKNFLLQDGNDLDAIESAIAAFHAENEKPTCIILDTLKGKGEPSRKRTMPDNSLSFLYFCASMVKIMGEIPNTERVSE